MDLEISTSQHSTGDYGHTHSHSHGISHSDTFYHKPAARLPSALPQASILRNQENDSWRGPSIFGMANILNRPSAIGVAPPSVTPSLPKFSLPSLHSFGKPLITKQEPSMNRVRSILNESPAAMPTSSGSASDGNVTSNSDSSPLTTAQSLDELQETPRNAAQLSRRIAPAPTEDDEGGDEESSSAGGNIRGGRWSSDEHERFLAGFRIHGHKWKRVQQVVRTRSVTQVRTHAQKYLLKLAKLNGDKKPSGGEGTNANSASDTESTHNHSMHDDGEERSPRKKLRRQDPRESVDEDYIAAAATTLCFLMRQKIDSLFDCRMEEEKDLEPYDCYAPEQPNSSDDHSIENSRKRPYMHFLAEESAEYSYAEQPTTASEGTGYSIDGKQLCS